METTTLCRCSTAPNAVEDVQVISRWVDDANGLGVEPDQRQARVGNGQDSDSGRVQVTLGDRRRICQQSLAVGTGAIVLRQICRAVVLDGRLGAAVALATNRRPGCRRARPQLTELAGEYAAPPVRQCHDEAASEHQEPGVSAHGVDCSPRQFRASTTKGQRSGPEFTLPLPRNRHCASQDGRRQLNRPPGRGRIAAAETAPRQRGRESLRRSRRPPAWPGAGHRCTGQSPALRRRCRGSATAPASALELASTPQRE
jgi:hypothetical protein